MGSWTVTSTPEQDAAITYGFQQAQKSTALAPPGVPVSTPPQTEAEFVQRQVELSTLTPLVSQNQFAKNQSLTVSLSSVPPENRAQVQKDIEAAILANGGTVPTTKLTYQWSANTAAPPRALSCELDQTEAKWATDLSKITFHYLDAGSVDRMASLLAIKGNALIRLEDAASAANFVTMVATATPVQRQGSNGYVEIAVRFNSKGGSFATLDTQPLTCSFA